MSGALQVASYNTSFVQLSNVRVSCAATPSGSGADAFTAAVAMAFNGSDLQTAMASASLLQQPTNLTLMSHVTLSPLVLDGSWPAAGYRVTRPLTIRGGAAPGGGARTVLDLGGASGFAQVDAGQLVIFQNVQLQGQCVVPVPIVPQLGINLWSMGDTWSVYASGQQPGGTSR